MNATGTWTIIRSSTGTHIGKEMVIEDNGGNMIQRSAEGATTDLKVTLRNPGNLNAFKASAGWFDPNESLTLKYDGTGVFQLSGYWWNWAYYVNTFWLKKNPPKPAVTVPPLDTKLMNVSGVWDITGSGSYYTITDDGKDTISFAMSETPNFPIRLKVTERTPSTLKAATEISSNPLVALNSLDKQVSASFSHFANIEGAGQSATFNFSTRVDPVYLIKRQGSGNLMNVNGVYDSNGLDGPFTVKDNGGQYISFTMSPDPSAESVTLKVTERTASKLEAEREKKDPRSNIWGHISATFEGTGADFRFAGIPVKLQKKQGMGALVWNMEGNKNSYLYLAILLIAAAGLMGYMMYRRPKV